MVGGGGKLRTLGLAALLLGCYHVVLQHTRFTHSDTPVGHAPRSTHRRARERFTHAHGTGGGLRSRAAAAHSSTTWRLPPHSNLQANRVAEALLGPFDPASTTLHFTFGSVYMLNFLRNWRHFAGKHAELAPAVVGAADSQMLEACTQEGIAALGLVAGLDVWTYTRNASREVNAVQGGKTEWKYYRHHKSSFLELGLVKAAFLWELLSLGYDVLISDLDVVWLGGEWEQWMTYRVPTRPPLPEAALLAMADVLVSTDELDEAFDAHGRWERWPRGVGWGRRTDLNTGVVYFRATNGSRAFIQAWRLAMLAKREVEHTNDQFVFVDMVRQAGMESVTSSAARLDTWRGSLAAHGMLREQALSSVSPSTRGVYISDAVAPPCLPAERCAPAHFTLGTLPLRVFTGGHTFFMQRVQNFEGHALPRLRPLTVHFTFQYSDTPDYPHGKRQRAREAALWTADPPEYYSEGRFVRLVGPLYTAAQRVAIERRFPEWSPRRHMELDAIQRAAVRDLLALSIALNATLIMPPLDCACDRYWGFLVNCRMPTAPEDMKLPFRCSQDALFEVKRWNDKGVRFREANFLDHPSVPAAIRAATVRLVVHPEAPHPPAGSVDARFNAMLRPGTAMSEVGRAVEAANPRARLIEVGVEDTRRLCRWLGSTSANKAFNSLANYVLVESARFCPSEDHLLNVANTPGWNWQNPFTACVGGHSREDGGRFLALTEGRAGALSQVQLHLGLPSADRVPYAAAGLALAVRRVRASVCGAWPLDHMPAHNAVRLEHGCRRQRARQGEPMQPRGLRWSGLRKVRRRGQGRPRRDARRAVPLPHGRRPRPGPRLGCRGPPDCELKFTRRYFRYI